jgi:hypothetical protein
VKLRIAVIFVLVALLPLQPFAASTSAEQFFIDTSGEWRSWRNDSPRKFNEASERIQGATTVFGLYPHGRLALISGFFSYDPETNEFNFDAGEGFGLSLGTWSQVNAERLEVEYRFALADKFVCSADDPQCEKRYKRPPEKATWRITRGGHENITAVEPDTFSPYAGQHVLLQKLTNQEEVDSMIAYTEKRLSGTPTTK